MTDMLTGSSKEKKRPLSETKQALLAKRLKGITKGQKVISPSAQLEWSPLSFSQQRIWLHDKMRPQSALYNIPAALRIRGSVQAEALEKALEQVSTRHGIMRTRFKIMEGEIRQQVEASVSVRLPSIDLRQVPEAELEGEVMRLAQQEAQKPFDTSNEQLWRASLLQLTEQEFVLLITMHHIISDGWSIGIFVRDLLHSYGAFATQKIPDPKPLSIQYADYALWQQEQWRQGAMNKSLDYWRTQLSGDLPVLQLPTDFIRPSRMSGEGAVLNVVLPFEMAERLKKLAEQQEATLFMVLLGAYLAFLSRYTEQVDLVVGVPSANRMPPETKDLIGCFINLLPIRTRLNRDESFLDLLKEVRQGTLNAFAHADAPFDKVIESLNIERHASVPPVFQTMFVMQNAPIEPMNLSGCQVSTIELHTGTAKYDLMLAVNEDESGLNIVWEYSTELFRENTIKRMAAHFMTMLAGIAETPETLLSRLPLLDENEKVWLTEDLNATYKEFDRPHLLQELLEQQAESTPDRTAVVFEQESLTYGELNQKANKLARLMRRKGVGPDVIVGVFMERSVEMVISLCAILKAGGAYLPLDPHHPSERIKFVIEDADLKVLLTRSESINNLINQNVETIEVDHIWPTLDGEESSDLEPLHTPEHLAYVIYTSGSTGKPKGTMNTHRGICNRLLWMQDAYQLTSADRVLQKTPYTFDVSVWEFFWPLVTGATLVVARPEGHKDSRYLINLVQKEQITTLHFVPSMLSVFLEEEEVGSCTSIKRVICSGEALSFELQERFFRRLSAELHNLYGPTEAAIDVTAHQCDPANTTPFVPIGKPIANLQIYILDRNLQPVPIGVAGELHIGGVGLARGYLNRPEMTNESFIRNPFSDIPEHRLYKTKDLARILEDGNIVYIGRLDHQVKIRGFRIELGEIEWTLYQHEAVKEVVVIAREDVPGNKWIVAYVVFKQNCGRDGKELKDYLAQSLPAYAIPSAFVFLESLPVTENGKLDRRQLPIPTLTSASQEFVSPRTEQETELVEIYSLLLNVESVSVDRGFFELGGNSLQALQLIHRVKAKFGVSLSIVQVFEIQTVAALARYIVSAGTDLQQKAVIQKISDRTNVPLSFAQESIWLSEQLNPGTGAYNIPGAVNIRGELDVAALHTGLQDMLQRHEVLRTCYELRAGKIVQVLLDTVDLSLNEIDLSGVPEAVRDAEVRRIFEAEEAKPFDLTQDVPVRAVLVRTGVAEHVFMLTMHHICSDGWSLNVFWNELSQLYEAYVSDSKALPETQSIQFSDYASWQRKVVEQGDLAEHQAYWKKQLRGQLPLLQLPAAKERNGKRTFSGSSRFFTIEKELAEALNRVALKTNSTMFMVLMSAYQMLLSFHSANEDIIVGTPVANRNHVQTETMVGCFINLLSIRSDLSKEQTLVKLLEQVRYHTLQAFEHQDMPFDLLLHELNPERTPGYTPIFQVMFTYHNTPPARYQVQGLEWTPMSFEHQFIKYDLLLNMLDSQDGLNGWLTFSTDLFDDNFVDRFLKDFRQILQAIAHEHEKTISEVFQRMLNNRKQEREKTSARRKESMRSKFSGIQLKELQVTSQVLTKSDYPEETGTLMLRIQPALEGVDFLEWAKSNKSYIKEELSKNGALLFRGFPSMTMGKFKQFTRIFGELLEYKEASTPRTQLEDNIYTSTEYPSDQEILQHNEHSYTNQWPANIWFFCETEPQQGGETPITDSAKVYHLIRPETRQKFEEKGILYVRNFTAGLDLPWQQVFQTEDRSEAELYCGQMGMGCEWLEEGHLRTSVVRPAVAKHPESGEKLWFNQAHLFHVSSLSQQAQDALKSVLKEEQLPRNTYYGDGEPIEPEVLDEIRAAYREATVAFQWKQGDILMLDNMKVAHGRRSFSGPRKIVVGMAGTCDDYGL